MDRNNIHSNDSNLKKILFRNAFPFFGLGSLIWFLIRVIPKPSRASYPCMRIAAPMASSFVLLVLGLTGTIFTFKRMKDAFSKSSYFNASIFFIIAFIFSIFTFTQSSITSVANVEQFDEIVIPNYPIGEAKGINPGRVVWIWNPDATNENCTNSYNGDSVGDDNDDGWFLDKNNDQGKIDQMLSESIRKLTGESSDFDSWLALFTYFNQNKYGRDEGYKPGKKLFIKINATSSWGKGSSSGNITYDNKKVENSYYAIAETSPHLILSLLRQLVNIYGVRQEDISVGDPMRHLYNHCYNKWHSEFPNIHYIANEGGNGREQAIPTDDYIIKYSDVGSELGYSSDKIYTVMNEANYIINVPSMKAHGLAGVTLFAKNHFGSQTRNSASHLHPGLVALANGSPFRTDSSIYRVQVDLMGHEKCGSNQVLFLLDALWSGSEAVDPPTKWDINPFNGDWTSSIFVSQDMVAIESVAFDFLYSEYDGSTNEQLVQKVNYPHMKGTTDYLRQAASSNYWPEGFIYDPEQDGIPIPSLGVNEHWNNPIDKKYSRNLGTGEGIELVFNDRVPVELSSFIAFINGHTILLNWTTITEINSYGFEIERNNMQEVGNQNFEWKKIGFVHGHGTSNSPKHYSFIDDDIKSGRYKYRLKQIDCDGSIDYSDIVEVEVGFPSKYELLQNYPNPFNPITIIKYSIPAPLKISIGETLVQLKIFDTQGSEIATLVNKEQPAGNYSIEFNGSTLPSGVYFYQLKSGEFVQMKKMVLMK